MKPDKNLVQQMIDLLRTFDTLKRQRTTLLKALDENARANGCSYASHAFAVVFGAAEVTGTDALMGGHPAGRVDADTFRDDVKKTILGRVDRVGLLCHAARSPDDPWPPEAAPLTSASLTPQAAAQPRRG
jgi:hypothetical protein